MAVLTKSQLKTVFSGLGSIYLFDGNLDLSSNEGLDMSNPKFDLPVTVDSFNFSQAEPTINATKVHGLNADWCSTSTAGDVTIGATVPSISDELNTYFLGGTGTALTTLETGPDGVTKWTGKAYELTNHKIVCSLALVDDSNTHLVVISGISLYATPNFENASTSPFSWTLTGSIETNDASDNNIAFFTKA